MAAPIDNTVELPQDRTKLVKFGDLPVEFTRHMQPLEGYGGLEIPIGIFVLDSPPMPITWGHINYGEVMKWLAEHFGFSFEKEAWSIVLPSDDGIGNRIIRVINETIFKAVMFNIERDLEKYKKVSRATSQPIKIVINIGKTTRSSPAAEATQSVAPPAEPSLPPPPSAGEHTAPSNPPTPAPIGGTTPPQTVSPPDLPDPPNPAAVAEEAGPAGPKAGDAGEPIDLTGSSPEPMPTTPVGGMRKEAPPPRSTNKRSKGEDEDDDLFGVSPPKGTTAADRRRMDKSSPWGMNKRRRQYAEGGEDEGMYDASPARRTMTAEGITGPSNPKEVIGIWDKEEEARWTPRLKKSVTVSPSGAGGDGSGAANRRDARLRDSLSTSPFSTPGNANSRSYNQDDDNRNVGREDNISRDVDAGENDGGDIEQEEDDGRDIDLEAPSDITELNVLGFPQDDKQSIEDFKAIFKVTDEAASKDLEIHGLLKPAHAHQASAAIWTLRRRTRVRDLFGAIIADGTGVGKTLLVFMVVLVSHQLLTRNYEVIESRKNPGKEGSWHLAKDAGPDEECPNRDNFHLQCPCKKGSVAEAIVRFALDGPALVIVPAALVNNWASEVRKFLKIDPNDRFCLRIHVLAAKSSKLTNPPTLGEEEIQRVIAEPTLREVADGHGDGARKEWPIKPRKGSSGVLFITSNTSVLNRSFRGLFQPPRPEDPQDPIDLIVNNSDNQKPQDWWVTFGSIFMDEFHQKKGWDTIPMRFARMMAKRGQLLKRQTLYVALTATPMEKGPVDISTFVRLLERPAWSQEQDGKPHHLHGLTRKMVKTLQSSFTAAAKEISLGVPGEHTALDKYRKDAAETLRGLIIRRLGQDKFLGKPISKRLSPLEFETIVGKTNARYKAFVDGLANRTKTEVHNAYQNLLTEWIKKGRHGDQPTPSTAFKALNMSRSFLRLRIAASFPAVADPKFDELPLRWELLRARIAKELVTPTEKGQKSVKELLAEVVDGSIKMNFLQQLINTMLADKDKRIDVQPGEDDGILEKKMVVLCHNPFVALVVAYELQRTRPNIRVDLLTSDVRSTKKNQILRDFELYEKPGTPMQGGQILVSTFGVSGTGLNLVRANHAVLFEFSWSSEVRTQAIGRIDREGQRHTPHVFQLYVDDNPAEQLINSRFEQRSKIAEGFWASQLMVLPAS